jgi:hypothetical protein
MNGDTNDEDPNIGWNIACHLNVLAHLFIILSFKVSF